MPLLNVYTSTPAPDDSDALLHDLSSAVARLVGKPERYVMVHLIPEQRMTFGGDSAPSAYAELKSVGKFSPDSTRKISAELCKSLGERLGVSKDRIYIEFTDAPGHLWGWNGETFG